MSQLALDFEASRPSFRQRDPIIDVGGPDLDTRREVSRKLMALDTAGRNNSEQRKIARVAAVVCFYENGPGIVSDVRAWCDKHDIELEWEKPWTGSLFQCGWFEATGEHRPAYHKRSNARAVKVWRLSDEGRFAAENPLLWAGTAREKSN